MWPRATSSSTSRTSGSPTRRDDAGARRRGQAGPAPATAAQLKGDAALVSLLRNAVEAASDDDGWAPLSSVGNIITNQRPDFDSRSYGYGKLSDLITATTLFEIERRSPGTASQASSTRATSATIPTRNPGPQTRNRPIPPRRAE